jgi:hypothetical protein
MLVSVPMNLLDLTINQLKRATAIKEQIEDLNKELRSILGASAKSGPTPYKRTTSAFRKKRVAPKPAAPAKPTAIAKKKTMSRATRAKLSAKLKAFWAAKKAGKK